MNALKFQNDAIEELISKFKKLYKINTDSFENTPKIILKAPTGSGKTFMTESFIHRLAAQPDFNEDVAFVWMTCSDTLAMQSRDKFYEYFSPNVNSRLLTAGDIEQNEFLLKNDILFSNWQKYNISKDKFDKRTLRRPDDERKLKENGFYFDDLIENTKSHGRQIILLIDESHAYDSKLAEESVIKTIGPKIIIKISATPFKNDSEKKDFYAQKGMGYAEIVEIKRDDVIAEGLIKESIVSQTEEDIMNYKVPDEDIEKLLLALAIEKQKLLRQEWQKLGFNINPLVMIQLPNDSKTKTANEIESKKTRVLQLLKDLGIEENKIATRLQETTERMNDITQNDSQIDFLLFKLAAATGWDCPRAHILVRYREIKSESFETQTLGRILRMPVVKKDFNNQLLQTGYLYTNFPKSSVHIPEETKENKAKVNHTQLDVEVKKSILQEHNNKAIEDLFKEVFVSESAGKNSENEMKAVFEKAVSDLEFVSLQLKGDSVKHNAARIEIHEKIDNLKNNLNEIVSKAVENIPQEQKEEVQNEISAKLDLIIQKTEDMALGEKETEIVFDPMLKTDFLSRADYGDLGKVSEFRKSFLKSMDSYFGIDSHQIYDAEELNKKLTDKGVILDSSIKQEIMVNAKFVSEQGFENSETGKNIDYETAQSNVEVAFTEMCYEILTTQTEEDAKVGNVARSWAAFRQTLRLWLTKHAFIHSDYLSAYKIFLNDCNKACVFKAAITNALKEYRKVLDEFITKRENSSCVSLPFTIKTHYSYTDEYEVYENASKSFVQPFYLKKEYNGRINETKFIQFLEDSPNVVNWFKNGDSGKDYFAIKYFDSTEKKNRLFYPDWFVVLDDRRICILDTKGGNTASSQETKEKAEALHNYIEKLNSVSKNKYVGGIVIIKENGQKYINDSKEYKYDSSNLLNCGWKTLSWKAL